MFPSYRHLSVDLQSKSTDWFLYSGNIGHLRVNFSNRGITGFGIYSLQIKFKLKDAKNIYSESFKLRSS